MSTALMIAAGVVAVIALFLVVAATRPAAYRVERALELGTSPDAAFAVLNDLRRFTGLWVMFGKPFTADPSLKRDFTGPDSGLGQACAWQGTEAGKGSLAISQSVPGQRVHMALEYLEPMASKAAYHFELQPSGGGTKVTWLVEGQHNFLGKAFSVLMSFDKMLGADLEKGLAALKAAAEQR